MSALNRLLQRYVDKSYDELLALANLSWAEVSDGIKQLLGPGRAYADAMILVVSACLGADNKLTELECRFLNDLLESDMTYEEVLDIVSAVGDDEGRDLTDRLANSLSKDCKVVLLSFCLCFLAVDETITREEAAFILKLME